MLFDSVNPPKNEHVTWITVVWFCNLPARSVKVLPVAKNGQRSEKRGCGSVGRASPCQGEGRGFESRHPLGRLAQRERASLTRKRSLVRSQYRPRSPLVGAGGHMPSRTSGARGCGSVGRASPCQGEGRGFESRHPLSIGNPHDPIGRGGLAERRGSGLQSRIHGFESRTHLGRLAQG